MTGIMKIVDEDKCGPYQHHTKRTDIFHVHELDDVKSHLVQLKVKFLFI